MDLNLSRLRLYLVRELGEHHLGRRGVEGGKLPVKVGKAHQGSEQNLGLYSGCLQRRSQTIMFLRHRFVRVAKRTAAHI